MHCVKKKKRTGLLQTLRLPHFNILWSLSFERMDVIDNGNILSVSTESWSLPLHNAFLNVFSWKVLRDAHSAGRSSECLLTFSFVWTKSSEIWWSFICLTVSIDSAVFLRIVIGHAAEVSWNIWPAPRTYGSVPLPLPGMWEGVPPLALVDGASHPPSDLDGFFYPAFGIDAFRCDSFALAPVHDELFCLQWSVMADFRFSRCTFCFGALVNLPTVFLTCSFWCSVLRIRTACPLSPCKCCCKIWRVSHKWWYICGYFCARNCVLRVGLSLYVYFVFSWSVVLVPSSLGCMARSWFL